MKNNWEIKKLGEVCIIQRGGSPRPISKYITDSDKGLNWIKIGDTTPNSRYITKTAEKIKPEGVSKTRVVHKGDFLLSNSMSFGRPYILGIDGCIHDGWLVIHDNNNIFNKSFLYFLLSSPVVKHKFESMAVGGVVNNLNTSMVSNLHIPIPPLPVQEAIVKELDTLHRLKELQEQQLAEYDTLAQATFYSMFGDPIENEKGWEVKKLGEVCEIVSGTTPKTTEPLYWNGNIKWITPSEIKETDFYIYDSERKITQKAISETGLKLFPINTVILSSRAPIGKVAIAGAEMCCNQGFKNLICKDNIIHHIFLYFLLKQNTLYLNSLGRGATFKEISKSIVSNIKFGNPDFSLQNQFAERIEKIKTQKELVKQGIAETQTLIDYTMDKYFG